MQRPCEESAPFDACRRTLELVRRNFKDQISPHLQRSITPNALDITMYLPSFLAALVLFLACVSAAPSPAPDVDSWGRYSQSGSGPYSPYPSAYCHNWWSGTAYGYEMTLINWDWDSRGCARGLEDNIHGKCGWPTGWTCNYIDGYPDDHVGARNSSVAFFIPLIPGGDCVTKAISEASGGMISYCNWQ